MPEWVWYAIGHALRGAIVALAGAFIVLQAMPTNVQWLGILGAVLMGAVNGWDQYRKVPK